LLVSLAPSGLETIAAINRFVRAGLEGNHGFLAAGCANSREHFPLHAVTAAAAASGLLTGSAAIRAALWFIIVALFTEERLIFFGKNKRGSTIFAFNGFVWHVVPSFLLHDSSEAYTVAIC
jgi:uncharacterized MAPEG superfamily protein